MAEYRTTWERIASGSAMMVAPQPRAPEGDGWRLAAATAWQGVVFFFWEREERRRIRRTPGVRGTLDNDNSRCSNPKCTSIAFVGGCCVGCGSPADSA